MSLKTTHSDDNIVVEEMLKVVYSMKVIEGSWPWESISLSGVETQMRECHRIASKSFRYVGMTALAAKTCAAAMRTLFTRDVITSVWRGNVNQGQWDNISGGTYLMSDVATVHNEDGSYDVTVNVNEDDVRFMKTTDTFTPETTFATERQRTYGSDGNGVAAEKEA